MIPSYNKTRCAAFPFETGIHFRRKTDFFPEEDTAKSYSGFEPEPTRLQAEVEPLNRGLSYIQAKYYCHTHNLLQVPIAELAERWTELPQVSDESRSFFRVHTGYFSNIPKCIKAEFIASWGCSQSSVVSSSKR
ncbi:poly polymerase [Trichonephila clavipes]|nr:poly polymerase [Trichonephila clavipes]